MTTQTRGPARRSCQYSLNSTLSSSERQSRWQALGDLSLSLSLSSPSFTSSFLGKGTRRRKRCGIERRPPCRPLAAVRAVKRSPGPADPSCPFPADKSEALDSPVLGSTTEPTIFSISLPLPRFPARSRARVLIRVTFEDSATLCEQPPAALTGRSWLREGRRCPPHFSASVRRVDGHCPSWLSSDPDRPLARWALFVGVQLWPENGK